MTSFDGMRDQMNLASQHRTFSNPSDLNSRRLDQVDQAGQHRADSGTKKNAGIQEDDTASPLLPPSANLGSAAKHNRQNAQVQPARKAFNDDLDYLLDNQDKPYLAQIAALESGDKSFQSKPARSNATVKKFLDDNLQAGAIDKGGHGSSDHETALMLQAIRKRDNNSRRSKESRKSAGRHLSRHIAANSDLLDLGLQVGDQVDEEEDEGATTRLSKRAQNQSMMDLQKGKLILDQAED